MSAPYSEPIRNRRLSGRIGLCISAFGARRELLLASRVWCSARRAGTLSGAPPKMRGATVTVSVNSVLNKLARTARRGGASVTAPPRPGLLGAGVGRAPVGDVAGGGAPVMTSSTAFACSRRRPGRAGRRRRSRRGRRGRAARRGGLGATRLRACGLPAPPAPAQQDHLGAPRPRWRAGVDQSTHRGTGRPAEQRPGACWCRAHGSTGGCRGPGSRPRSARPRERGPAGQQCGDDVAARGDRGIAELLRGDDRAAPPRVGAGPLGLGVAACPLRGRTIAAGQHVPPGQSQHSAHPARGAVQAGVQRARLTRRWTPRGRPLALGVSAYAPRHLPRLEPLPPADRATCQRHTRHDAYILRRPCSANAPSAHALRPAAADDREEPFAADDEHRPAARPPPASRPRVDRWASPDGERFPQITRAEDRIAVSPKHARLTKHRDSLRLSAFGRTTHSGIRAFPIRVAAARGGA